MAVMPIFQQTDIKAKIKISDRNVDSWVVCLLVVISLESVTPVTMAGEYS